MPADNIINELMRIAKKASESGLEDNLSKNTKNNKNSNQFI
jgi:hypothetical protein